MMHSRRRAVGYRDVSATTQGFPIRTWPERTKRQQQSQRRPRLTFRTILFCIGSRFGMRFYSIFGPALDYWVEPSVGSLVGEWWFTVRNATVAEDRKGGRVVSPRITFFLSAFVCALFLCHGNSLILALPFISEQAIPVNKQTLYTLLAAKMMRNIVRPWNNGNPVGPSSFSAFPVDVLLLWRFFDVDPFCYLRLMKITDARSERAAKNASRTRLVF